MTIPINNQDAVAGPIFDMVNAHLNIPEVDCTGDFPAAPEVPVANFSSVIGITLPPAAPFTPHPIPTDGTISASPVSPTYSEAYADIATISLVGVNNALYSDYVLPDSLPTAAASAPNLAYPEAGFGEAPSDAGLDDTLTAPVITVGTTPEFYDIPSVDYDMQDIEKFEVEIPVPPSLPDVVLMSDPAPLDFTFSPELLAAIDKAIDGDEVITQEAQRILMERASRELDDATQEAERGAFIKSAEAGFSETNGPLVEILSKIAKDSSYKDRAVYEVMRTEAYTRALGQVTEAIKSGLVLEAANLSIHLSYAGQLIEVLKFNVAIQGEYVNLLISMFNSQLTAARGVVSAYEAYVQTLLADYKAQGAVITAQGAILDTNSAKLSVMDGQTKTVDAQAQVYSLEIERRTHELAEFSNYVDGVIKNVNIARTNIEAYKSAIKQYSLATESDKATIEGYAAQVRATGSATGVYEANWDSFSAAYSASGANSDAVRNWYTSSNQSLTAEIGSFSTAAAEQRRYTQTLADWVTANDSMSSDYASGVNAEIGYIKDFNNHSISLTEAGSAIDLATEDASVRMQALTAQAEALQSSIDVGLTAAEATSAAGCAQAAYSVRSISANLRATAGMSDAGTTRIAASTTDSVNRSYAYNKTRSIEA
jgi:hypothetical protein